MSASVKFAINVKLFQALKEAGDAGLSPKALATKTGVDVTLLSRLKRHLTATYLVKFKNGAFFGTVLSNDLAAENYQHSISFCYDVARPSFNGFPTFFP